MADTRPAPAPRVRPARSGARRRARTAAAVVLGGALVVAGMLAFPAQQGASAQEAPVNLLADRLSYDQESETLVAEGNVEVIYEGRMLRAARVTYDRRRNLVQASGPLTVTGTAGEVLLADFAELDPELRDGLVRGARLMIEDQLQVASSEIRRSGRFTTLYRTVASACTVCAENPTPTWAIRAARVTEDAEARRIYFEDATLEVMGLPVGFLPRFSIADPRAGRASGFLTPAIRQSDIYGFGVKVPYYFAFGPSSDATLTPFVTTGGTVILEGEYRRRLASGGFDVGGILAIDDGLSDDEGGLRGFFTAEGAFALGRGFITDFDINVASDRTFLQQFDYTDDDRLTSLAGIHRTRDKDNLDFGAVAFQSLREGEDTGTVPFVLPYLGYRRVMADPLAGGRLAFDVDLLGLLRRDGNNMVRGGGGVDWRRDWTLANGVLAAATAGAPFDFYRVWSDTDAAEGTLMRTVPVASAELRWPFLRSGGGVSEVLEPIAQVFWSEVVGDSDVPNEDSQLPEFDATNLFSGNRFPGRDRYETGLRANLGITYDRLAPSGWNLGVTAGRVLHTDPVEDMPEGTGLAGRWSDYVGAVALGYRGLTVADRALLRDNLSFRRNDIGVKLDGERGEFATTWVYLAADDSNPILGPQPETSELRLDGRYRIHANWEIRGQWRYDLVADQPLRAGAGITYGNECTELDLSISRRYTSTDNLPPSTSVGFSVALAGFGSPGDRRWPERVCRGTAG